jgi:signal transduction histidine kinase
VYLHGSALASLVIVVIVQRRLARDPVARRQVAWMTYSLLPVLLIGVPARLFLPRDIGSPLASLVSVIPPVVVAAVVMRYRLFQFDALAPRASVYAIMVAGSMLLYVVLLATAGRLVGGLVGSRGEIVRLGALAVVVAIFEPLRSLARDGIDRLFSRDRPALQARCARVVTQLDGAFDDEEICAATQRGLDAWVTRLLDLPRELSAPERPSRELDRLGALRVVELDDPATVDGLLARRIDALVAVPVEPGSGGPWALALGFPASAHPWDRLERDALSSVGRAVGAALDQRAARRALATEIERAEEERQRIARELHDGLGATLTAASLTTQLARKAQDGAGPMEALDTLDRTLREGLADLRVALWSLDARFASWDDLYTRLRRHVSDLCAASGLSLEMSGRCEGAGKASPLLRLTAYRIVQEAVNNAVRHARAQRLRVDLQADPSGVEIVVEDDGVGLLPEAAGHAAPGRETGRGLSNMVRRVEDLHGTIRFSRPAGGGSAIHVKLPGATRAAGVSASSS